MELKLIRIIQYPAPPDYENRVKRPGINFLTRNPHPTASQFSRHNYWKEVHGDLYLLYRGICAYCASWSPRSPRPKDSQTSVDHFIPKSLQPVMAYEWSNFRLCRSRLNSNKGNSLEVMDPFYIQNGWFSIDFSSFLLKSSSLIPDYIKSQVITTINTLGLNHNDYVNERVEVIRGYCRGQLTLPQLNAKWPFIAAEMVRQDFDSNYAPQMRLYFRRFP